MRNSSSYYGWMNFIVKAGIAFILIGLVTFVFLSFRANSRKESTKPLTGNPTPIPIVSPKISNNDKTKLAFREAAVTQSKQQLKKGNVNIYLAGENKTIMVIESKSLPTHEITMMFRDSLENLRGLGFDQIKISDKEGNNQDIDLTVLDMN